MTKTKEAEVNFKDIPEMTEANWARVIRRSTLLRLRKGEVRSGDEIAALRRFIGLSQPEFAAAMKISVYTLRNWEQGRRKPHGPALALLSIAAQYPRIIRQNAERLGKSEAA